MGGRLGVQDAWEREGQEFWESVIRMTYKAASTQLITADQIVGNDSHRLIWTFEASIFFATTIITTIGKPRPLPVASERPKTLPFPSQDTGRWHP